MLNHQQMMYIYIYISQICLVDLLFKADMLNHQQMIEVSLQVWRDGMMLDFPIGGFIVDIRWGTKRNHSCEQEIHPRFLRPYAG